MGVPFSWFSEAEKRLLQAPSELARPWHFIALHLPNSVRNPSNVVAVKGRW
jgi:hypothetical protein